jgi:uncharacterized membrane protein YphA (DoxX/SURF4 family)
VCCGGRFHQQNNSVPSTKWITSYASVLLSMRKQKGLGLLLLRGAGFLLALTFGVQKIGWYWSALHAGKSFSSIGLAPLIAKMGFPIPVALAIWITFNESIGALLIGCGLLTRLLSASLALGMAGALYVSVRLGEDWLRAALYLIIFISLILTGPRRIFAGSPSMAQ